MTRLDALIAIAAGQDVALPDTDVQEPHGLEPEGPSSARIMLVVDHPSQEDMDSRQFFGGLPGKKLQSWLRFAGIERMNCRIIALYPHYPIRGEVPADMAERRERCKEEVRRCTNAEVIVCMGDEALETFTGLRQVVKRRGSVYRWEGKKVLGVVHPATVLRQKDFEQHSRHDMERVKLLATPHDDHHAYCGCAWQRPRTVITPYTESVINLRMTINRYIRRAYDRDPTQRELLAIDIETPKKDGTRAILCVGFAFSADEALVLHWDEHREAITKLCESPVAKLGHYFVSYDRWWLKRNDIDVGGQIYDTCGISHALSPASRHGMDFLQSVYTFMPYHKEQGKGHDVRVIEKDYPGYYNYCGLDCCVTRELYDVLWPILERRGLVDFYRKNYEELYDPILDLMDSGVLIDHVHRETVLSQLLTTAREARDRLGEINGAPLFTLTSKKEREIYATLVPGQPLAELAYSEEDTQKTLDVIAKKTVSGAQLKALLYGRMGLEPHYKRRDTGDMTLTADGVTLKKLKQEYPDRQDVTEIVDLAMQHNRDQKLASFLYPTHFSKDGRFRFTLSLTTEASRFASSRAPDGTCSNSQNWPRDKRIRSVIVPEKGHVLYEVDGAQIESRLCFVLSKDPDLIRMARLTSAQFDQHKYVVSILPQIPGTCFGFALDEIPGKSEERQAAKSVSHSAQGHVQPKTAQETLLKQNEKFAYTEEQVAGMLEAYHKVFPGIRAWHAMIRKELRATKALHTDFGHTWDVRYEEMNDDLYRRAYRWKLQRYCAWVTNMFGFKPLYNLIKREGLKSRVLLQEHDSIVVSCPPEEVYDIAVFMGRNLSTSNTYEGVELSIPVEHGIGKNWGQKESFDVLPDRVTFESRAKEMLT